ncbi:MAG: hypothetical protein M1831_003073 [Alyxoria varia]|nr:MAG: hypothetical protein M1831_003073 [Alyxoria varia]
MARKKYSSHDVSATYDHRVPPVPPYLSTPRQSESKLGIHSDQRHRLLDTPAPSSVSTPGSAADKEDVSRASAALTRGDGVFTPTKPTRILLTPDSRPSRVTHCQKRVRMDATVVEHENAPPRPSRHHDKAHADAKHSKEPLVRRPGVELSRKTFNSGKASTCESGIAENIRTLKSEGSVAFQRGSSNLDGGINDDLEPEKDNDSEQTLPGDSVGTANEQDGEGSASFSHEPLLNRRLRPSQRLSPRSGTRLSPTQLPDRFIKPRTVGGSGRSQLVISKPTTQLNTHEKALRRRTGFSDPFAPGTRVRQQPVEEPRSAHHRIMWPSRLRTGEPLAPRQEPPRNSNRQVSLGAVWNVGGSAAAAQINVLAPTEHVLEAPNLRDDYYCSVLAYSRDADRLAVGLGEKVYLWSEPTGARPVPQDVQQNVRGYVTSLSFSSSQGGQSILALGRSDGSITLWSPTVENQRFLRIQPSASAAASHVSFSPFSTRRTSQRHEAFVTEQEILLVGDDLGIISVYFVEWPKPNERFLFGWGGSVTCNVKLSIHTQQICGMAWSSNGEYLATGGNDNLCCLVETRKLLTARARHSPLPLEVPRDSNELNSVETPNNGDRECILGVDAAKHQWRLNAAVKAIAFCPWQRGLLAAGGGSNDRCIHFYHTMSGAALATIDCAAQVTSLIWSQVRRELVATFGFAQPEHPFRVAVYAWPSCQQIVAIPWHDEMRALYAIPYPRGPDQGRRSREGASWSARTANEGCIVVAGSDGSIKFHEVWCEAKRAAGPHRGLLGGSDIIESLHGIDKDEDEVIR